VSATVLAPPAWLAEANDEVWSAVARLAESGGEWAAASLSWEAAAGRETGDVRADRLVAAAVAAEVGGDDERHERLLGQARSENPRHPRLILEEADDNAPGAEQLRELESLESEDPSVQTLISAHRALASLLLPDIDQARRHLTEAAAHGPDTPAVEAVKVNLAVQQGRLDRVNGRPVNAPQLREASRDALALRDRMLSERRFVESGRLLMLAADALMLLGERSEAAQLLDGAQPGELSAPDGAVVLASSALRSLRSELALRLVEHAPASGQKDLVRAAAHLELGTLAEKSHALETLDRLVAEEGPEADEAALIRLTEPLGKRHVPWSNAAAKWLRDRGHERPVVMTEAILSAERHADFRAADGLLAAHGDAHWALATRLRLAMKRGNYTAQREAADAVMAIGPSQALAVEAGAAYYGARDYQQARVVLMGVARDPSAPATLRADAYALLMRVVGNVQEDWKLAQTLHQEWVGLRPTDTRAPQWAPRIANRLASN
jgi:hypothetical protein